MKAEDLDLRVIGRIKVTPPIPTVQTPADKLSIGASISRRDGRAGTLGFFAYRNGDRGFVSCNHVIAKVDEYAIDDEIISPADSDRGTSPQNLAGKLRRVARLTGGRFKKSADCAFARVDSDRWPDHPGSLGPDGSLSADWARIRRGLPVVKVGRSTGRRTGRIRTSWIDWFQVDYGHVTVRFDDVFEIEATEDENNQLQTFSDPGDSGSLVRTRYGDIKHPVGLLFTESAIGGPNDTGFSYANPIGRVTHLLGVRMAVD